MTAYEKPPPAACRVCGHALNVRIDVVGDDHVVTYIHPRGMNPALAAHDVDAFLINESNMLDQVTICDFCTNAGAPWIYPATDFGTAVLLAPGVVEEHFSGGDWGACHACRDDIDADRWDAVLERFLASRTEMPGMRKVVEELHAGFRKHRTGPPVLAA